jgi:hypothetical protein
MNKPQTPEAMIEDLRVIVAGEHSTPEMRRRAITLAYEIGRTQGRSEGAIAGITQMHDAAQKSITDAFASPRSELAERGV